MKEYQKEIIKLTAKEVLLRVFDLAAPFYEADHVFRVSAKSYKAQRNYEKSCFSERIQYLKRRGLIESFVEGKEQYIEITPIGLEKVKEFNFDRIKIDRPKLWDKKWRIVFFDIPDKHKRSRDIFRYKILSIGFQKIQESVYVYPFECSNEIRQISESLLVENFVLLMVSDIIQGEDTIIERFIDSHVLEKNDLVGNHRNK